MTTITRILRERNIVVVTLICSVVFYLISPRFLSLDNLSAISRSTVSSGLIERGELLVIVLGTTALSLGMA